MTPSIDATDRVISEFETRIRRRIDSLRRDYLSAEGTTTGAGREARAALSRLRDVVQDPTAKVAAVMPWIANGVVDPDSPRVDDEEDVTWRVLSLYALHQTTKREPAHRDGVRLGVALATLRNKLRGGASGSVDTRFNGLTTADDLDDATRHLQGLVKQLQIHKMPIDYGRLAGDLMRFLDPEQADEVRLRWGRDYHYRSADAPEPVE